MDTTWIAVLAAALGALGMIVGKLLLGRRGGRAAPPPAPVVPPPSEVSREAGAAVHTEALAQIGERLAEDVSEIETAKTAAKPAGALAALWNRRKKR